MLHSATLMAAATLDDTFSPFAIDSIALRHGATLHCLYIEIAAAIAAA